MTEQFALGSIYYLMNYGFEVYGDRCLTNDSYEHEPKVVDLLQNMEFPRLNGNLEIDEIINKCWHNQDAMVSDLAAYTKKLLQESTDMAGDSELRGRSEKPYQTHFYDCPIAFGYRSYSSWAMVFPWGPVDVCITEHQWGNNHGASYWRQQ
jgi:hypothetical protein